MTVEQLRSGHVRDVVELLDDLRVSLFGVSSRRLHVVLARDAAAGIIDGRVAVDGGRVKGVVLAAPARYWRSALLRHWRLAIECVGARLSRRAIRDAAAAPALRSIGPAATDAGTRRRPQRSGVGGHASTWTNPGDAWRIIIVGTAASARGAGVGGAMYRRLMAERSLVARIAPDNTPSIRLHESLGWQIFPDGDVLLAVHNLQRGRALTRANRSHSADAVAG